MVNRFQQIATALGITLPGAYARFIETEQLQESRLVTDLVNLYGTDDLVTRNNDYQVQHYLPGYLSIADDSGGCGIFLNTTETTLTVYTTGYGALDLACMDVLSDDFLQWPNKATPSKCCGKPRLLLPPATQRKICCTTNGYGSIRHFPDSKPKKNGWT